MIAHHWSSENVDVLCTVHCVQCAHVFLRFCICFWNDIYMESWFYLIFVIPFGKHLFNFIKFHFHHSELSYAAGHRNGAKTAINENASLKKQLQKLIIEYNWLVKWNEFVHRFSLTIGYLYHHLLVHTYMLMLILKMNWTIAQTAIRLWLMAGWIIIEMNEIAFSFSFFHLLIQIWSSHSASSMDSRKSILQLFKIRFFFFCFLWFRIDSGLIFYYIHVNCISGNDITYGHFLLLFNELLQSLMRNSRKNGENTKKQPWKLHFIAVKQMEAVRL